MCDKKKERRHNPLVIFSNLAIYIHTYVLWKFLRHKQCCLTIISRNDCRVCKMSVCQRYMYAWKEFPKEESLIDFVCLLPADLLSRHPRQIIFNSLWIRFILFSCCLSHCFGLNERREPKMIYRTLSNPDRLFSWKRFIIFLSFGHTGFFAVKRTLLWSLCNHELFTAHTKHLLKIYRK